MAGISVVARHRLSFFLKLYLLVRRTRTACRRCGSARTGNVAALGEPHLENQHGAHRASVGFSPVWAMQRGPSSEPPTKITAPEMLAWGFHLRGHIEQLYGFSTDSRRSGKSARCRGHIKQAYSGVSLPWLVWVCSCRNGALLAEPPGDIEQAYGLSPVWAHSCQATSLFWVNRLWKISTEMLKVGLPLLGAMLLVPGLGYYRFHPPPPPPPAPVLSFLGCLWWVS